MPRDDAVRRRRRARRDGRDAGLVLGDRARPGRPATRRVGGRRVALASARTTRGRELRSATAVYALSTGRIRSPQQFVDAITRFELSFNGFYVDSKHIAYASAGRLPIRAPGVDPGLPTIGTGEYEWRGFLAPNAHPQAIDPPGGAIVNWNNKPAPGFAASDENWAYGSVQRVELLRGAAEAAEHRRRTSCAR